MTTSPRVVTALASSLTVALLCADPAPALGQTATKSVIRDAATGKLQPTQLPSLTGIKRAPFISGGTLVTAIEALTLGAADDRQEAADANSPDDLRSEEHTSELQSPCNLVCRLLLEKKKPISCRPYSKACGLSPNVCNFSAINSTPAYISNYPLTTTMLSSYFTLS